MDSLLKSDIFFFITSVCVVVVSSLLAYALVYIVGILRDVKRLSTRIDKESERIIEGINTIQGSVTDRLMRTSLFRGLFGVKKKTVHKKKDKSV